MLRQLPARAFAGAALALFAAGVATQLAGATGLVGSVGLVALVAGLAVLAVVLPWASGRSPGERRGDVPPRRR